MKTSAAAVIITSCESTVEVGKEVMSECNITFGVADIIYCLQFQF